MATEKSTNTNDLVEQTEVMRTALYLCSLKYRKLNPVVAQELELELKKDGLHKRPRGVHRQPIMAMENGEASSYNGHQDQYCRCDNDDNNKGKRLKIMHARQARDQKTLSTETIVYINDNNKLEGVKIMHARQGGDQKTVSTKTSVDKKSELPMLPPIPALNGLIAECSKPYEKVLTESDIKDNQGRLTIKKRFVKDELVKLLKPDEKLVDGIKVKAYDSEGKEYTEMVFKLWGDKMYVLTSSWKQFCHDQNLVKDTDFITLWMFRNTNGELCFAITSRRVSSE